MSDYDPNNPQAASDPPIIIQGGNSVEVDVPAGFAEQGTGKKFKKDKADLDSLQINTNTPIKLNKGDKISITYK